MSRIGKQPVIIPDNVTIILEGNSVAVKGPKGELKRTFHELIDIKHEDNKVIFTRKDDSKLSRSLHGLSRSLMQNMVTGVKTGYEKRLEIIGVGYRAKVSGQKLILSLGYSHPVDMLSPQGVTVELDKDKKNILVITGIDKEAVGQFASQIREKRKPEPYKGKGIRYLGEYVPRKAGKTAAKA